MIIAASVDDIDEIVIMGKAFFDESGYSNETQFDESTFRLTCASLIESGCIFIAKDGARCVGMISGMAYPFYFNANHKTAQELFWWVSPESRGSLSSLKLLKALEDWAKAQGCKSISMISLPKLSNSPASAIYRKAGYRESELSFIRSL